LGGACESEDRGFAVAAERLRCLEIDEPVVAEKMRFAELDAGDGEFDRVALGPGGERLCAGRRGRGALFRPLGERRGVLPWRRGDDG